MILFIKWRRQKANHDRDFQKNYFFKVRKKKNLGVCHPPTNRSVYTFSLHVNMLSILKQIKNQIRCIMLYANVSGLVMFVLNGNSF